MKFGVNWDYRCPFARNLHEHLVTALKSGADKTWDVDFIPFSLSQVHIEEDEPPVWEDASKKKELLAVAAGLATHHLFGSQFYDVHLDMFSARHDQARDITDWNVIADILEVNGVDSAKVRDEIDNGTILNEFQERHEQTVRDFQVFGVPTVFLDGTATFARIMTRPKGDGQLAERTIQYLLNTVTLHPEFNEIKHTKISR